MPKSKRRRRDKRTESSRPANWSGGGKYDSGKKRRDWLIAAIVGVAVLAGAGYWLFGTIGAHQAFASLAADGAAALDRVSTQRNDGRQHVPYGTALIYESDFPTSGTHWPRWTVPGVYDRPQPKPELVHALEHGNIVVYYENPSAAAWDDLNAWADLFTGQWDGLVVTKFPGLGEEIVLTAWIKTLRMESWDRAVAAAFVDTYRGRGPENPVR